MLDDRKIKGLRLERGLTQAALSRVAEITIATISKIENGHSRRISMLNLQKLAKALKVKPAELLK